MFTKCNENEQRDQSAQSTNSFVGSATCQSCHEEQFNEWQDSHHDWAMKKPDESTVLGDFNSTFDADGVSYQFHKKKEKYLVTVTERGQQSQDFEIAYTFGYYPLQQYLVKFPEGKFQTLRVSWDAMEKKWFHQYAGQEIAVEDWLHWTQGGQRWNTMCADCHSTDVRKNYSVADDTFNTTFAEINVGCEACHGMGAKHIRWAEDGAVGNHGLHLGLSSSQQEELNTCAPCHSRRVKFQEVFGPRSRFTDHFLIQNLNPQYYELDGQIKEEDYVMASFMQSKMFHNDVKCSDCHNPHSLTLKLEGNLLCLQCHEPNLNSPSHHFHDLNLSNVKCVDCHMEGKVYMGNDYRRDHSFRIPRPDLSVEYGVSNACNACHSDKTDQWAADYVIQWYGQERKKSSADYLTLAHGPDLTPQEYSEMLEFIQNDTNPVIVRSTLIQVLPGFVSDSEVQTLLRNLSDSNALIRYNALQHARSLPLQERMAIALKHLDDEARIVRVCAINLIVDVDPSQLGKLDRQKYDRAENELMELLETNADFPSGRIQFGDFYLRKNNYQKAIKHYRIALKMDSLNTVAFGNLATAYNLVEKNDDALNVLNQWIKIERQNARAYYLRSILQHEMGLGEKAILDMQNAVSLNPGNSKYLYNLSYLYFQKNDFNKAEKFAQKALDIDPDSQQNRDLLELIQSRIQL